MRPVSASYCAAVAATMPSKIACLLGKWLYSDGALMPTALPISPMLTAS